MALTDATRLADFSSGVGTDGTLSANNINATGIVTAATLKVGSAVTVSGGIVTATQFVGDGSELTGVSGFATALSNDSTSSLNKVFKTPKTLTIGAGVSVTVASDTASGNIAFMREGSIHVGSGSTFHVGSGTTLLTNILSVF